MRGGSPGTVNGRCELTGPGRKPQEPATRAGCSGSVPRTPCPCGLSAAHAPVGRQTYLLPRWDERAPSRPTYQRPNSLPQSPRGFASSWFSLLPSTTPTFVSLPHRVRFDTSSSLRTTGVLSVFRHGWRTPQDGMGPRQGGPGTQRRRARPRPLVSRFRAGPIANVVGLPGTAWAPRAAAVLRRPPSKLPPEVTRRNRLRLWWMRWGPAALWHRWRFRDVVTESDEAEPR
jgi:hypothetical protein